MNHVISTNNIIISDASESTRRNRIIQGIVDLVGIIIGFLAFAFIEIFVPPKIRYFTCAQSDIVYPYIENTINFDTVVIYGTLSPLVLIILVELYNAKLYPYQIKTLEFKTRFRSFLIIMFHSLSLFFFGMSFTLLLTSLGKRFAGRLRPNFLAVCKPNNLNSSICISSYGTYNAIYTGGSFCTGHANKVAQARMSFPSGHSSFSTYTMLFLVIYLQARLVTLKFRAIRPLIQVTAISAAWITCLSRIVDYHHRGSDVLGGVVLGVLVALAFTLVFGKILWAFGNRKKEVDFDQNS